MKVKVTPRVLNWLAGTGVGQQVWSLVSADAVAGQVGEDEANVATMILKTRDANQRADGSLWPDLTREEIQELMEWSDYFAHASVDSAKDSNLTGDMDGLADLNAARAQIKRCQEALDKLERIAKWNETH